MEVASEKQILKDSHQKETERGVQLKAHHEETTKRNEELKAKIEEIKSSKYADSLGNLSGYCDALADEVKSQQIELLGLRGEREEQLAAEHEKRHSELDQLVADLQSELAQLASEA